MRSEIAVYAGRMEENGGRTDACVRCGKDELRMLAGRVGKPRDSGYLNLFQCVACGHLNWRDIPHQPPGKRT